jgi:hypothetical protein
MKYINTVLLVHLSLHVKSNYVCVSVQVFMTCYCDLPGHDTVRIHIFFLLKLKLPVAVCIIKKRVFTDPSLLLVCLTKGSGTRHCHCKEIHFKIEIIVVVLCVSKYDCHLLHTLIHGRSVLIHLYSSLCEKKKMIFHVEIWLCIILTFGLGCTTFGGVSFTLLTGSAVFAGALGQFNQQHVSSLGVHSLQHILAIET